MIFKKKSGKKRSRAMLSAYSIIMILIILLGIASHLLPKAQFEPVPAEDEAKTATVKEETLGAEVASETTTQPATEGEVVHTVIDMEEEKPLDATEKESTNSTKSLEDCKEKYGECQIVNGSGVVGAKFFEILMAPILGFENAIDVCIFVMVLGGFLAVMARTKALETGIKILVKKLHGKEYLLILLLMFIFSVLGTTYGFLEESVGFYIMIAATMYAAGLDPLVGVATILLGAGSGVLGSTINPFATGAVLSAMKSSGIAYDQGTVLLIATVLWLTTLAISATFVVLYAKKVQRDKGSTFLSLREQAVASKTYDKYLSEKGDDAQLTTKQKITLCLFAFSFLVMIIGFIPWFEFTIGEDSSIGSILMLENWSSWLTGNSLGSWWFFDSALWFLIIAIIIAVINGFGEHGFVDAFIDGADDMVGVILVIAVARGASVLMGITHLDNYIIYSATDALKNVPTLLFVPLNYILHVFLSILVPSSSGLAQLSTPIVAPVAANVNQSVEVTAMTIVASNGLVNLITPTCGAIMGGLALAKIDYPTWFKWALKVVAVIAVVNIAVLLLFSFI